VNFSGNSAPFLAFEIQAIVFDLISPPAAVTTSEPDQVLDLKQQGRALRNALAVLSDDERQTIETAFFGELTYAEVATRLAQPVGTVKPRVRSGLEKLRQALDEGERRSETGCTCLLVTSTRDELS
jgi:RNA polymerase sigma factor (sigma-70 family)